MELEELSQEEMMDREVRVENRQAKIGKRADKEKGVSIEWYEHASVRHMLVIRPTPPMPQIKEAR